MALTELQKAKRGTSHGNVRRGLKAHQTKIENARRVQTAMREVNASLSTYESFQRETYGGAVTRTVLRTPRRADLGDPQVIDADKARFECSGWAELTETGGTEFEGFEGKQIRYLLTLDGMFLFPSFTGAFGELLDAGCSIRTKLAVYSLKERIVKKV